MDNWIKVLIGLGVATALYLVIKGVTEPNTDALYDEEDMAKLTPESKQGGVCIEQE